MSDLENIFDEKFILMLERIREMFLSFGIKTLNMDDISRKLGISKKTLYRYFDSKECLIERILEYDNLGWVHFTDQLRTKPLNAIDKLLEVSVRVHEEMKKYNPRLIFELKKFYEPLVDKYLEQRRSFIQEKMRINLMQGISEGLYRQDLNLDLIVSLYVNHLVEVHSYGMNKIANVTFDEIFQVMIENHIRAISTSAGLAYFENKKEELSGYLNNNNL